MAGESGIYELRQYTLHPGQREVLVELFDRELVESQEALGMEIVGQFRDLDRPDRFVWVRGFADMEARHEALSRFYGGPVWAEHKDAANATMIDFDDVLLLRPIVPFPRDTGEGALVVTVHPPGDAEALARGAFALLRTEPAPNTFTALPVREADVIVRFARGDEAPPGAPLQTLRLQPTPRSRLR